MTASGLAVIGWAVRKKRACVQQRLFPPPRRRVEDTPDDVHLNVKGKATCSQVAYSGGERVVRSIA
jgi:hypothetical protein